MIRPVLNVIFKENIDDGEYIVKIRDIRRLDHKGPKFLWYLKFVGGKYDGKTLLHYSNYMTEQNIIFFKRDLTKAGCENCETEENMMNSIKNIIGNYIKIYKKTKHDDKTSVYVIGTYQHKNIDFTKEEDNCTLSIMQKNKKPRQVFFGTNVKSSFKFMRKKR